MKYLRRRKFFVYKALQYRLLIVALGHIVFFLAVISAALFVPLMMTLDNEEVHFEEVAQAANQLLYLHEHFWPIGLLALLVIGLHSIAVSHKIAGPLYRFNLLFEALKEGHLPKPSHLRKGDYLHREMEVINKMIVRLQLTIRELQTAQACLHQEISALQAVASSASKEEIVKRITRISEKGQQLADTLEYFQIET